MRNHYDIIVIGAGHAGCEAAFASATMGASTLLITMDLNRIAQMSCNPSIGGIAKGQIIREIDALGGMSAIITDASTLQFRMLNRSKGPAMWSPRAQCDRISYSQNWRWVLENTPGLFLWQDNVVNFNFSPQGDIAFLETSLGGKFSASFYILTAGTFLNGRIFVGDRTAEGGRVAEPSSYYISTQLLKRGIRTSRMKTGTPPRVDIRTVDLSMMIPQLGDDTPDKFSYIPYLSSAQREDIAQMQCYIAHTNPAVHDILRSGFDKSPLFSGKITGIGPRYCPSIEDKLRTFSDKDSHQIFLEPEGRSSTEYYLQGFSSSLPFEIQLEALTHVEGFNNVHLLRPAYAIEYDFFDPTQLDHTLRSKVVPNLYLAGQVNGTTGYEEAAAQGIVAGINSVLRLRSKDEFLLLRDSSYIGVLIDDLVTKGVDEPYRMFTSRAEYRILLRQDNADERLTPLSYELGLASAYRMSLLEKKKALVSDFSLISSQTKPSVDEVNCVLESKSTSPISSPKSISSLVTRPQVALSDLLPFVPRGTISDLKQRSQAVLSWREFLPSQNIPESVKISLPDSATLFPSVVSSTEILIKYSGYIQREAEQAKKIKKLESLKIPRDFDYSRIGSLSMESRIKLSKHQPSTIAEASRIPGVSPADISVLLVYFGR